MECSEAAVADEVAKADPISVDDDEPTLADIVQIPQEIGAKRHIEELSHLEAAASVMHKVECSGAMRKKSRVACNPFASVTDVDLVCRYRNLK